MTTTLDHLEPNVNCVYLMEFRNDFFRALQNILLYLILVIIILLQLFSAFSVKLLLLIIFKRQTNFPEFSIGRINNSSSSRYNT